MKQDYKIIYFYKEAIRLTKLGGTKEVASKICDELICLLERIQISGSELFDLYDIKNIINNEKCTANLPSCASENEISELSRLSTILSELS